MKTSVPALPSFRRFQVFPAPPGREGFVLEDPEGLVEGQLLVTRAALLLLSLCDGTRDRDALCRDFAERAGTAVTAEQMEGFLLQMTEALLFDCEESEARKRARLAAFSSSPWRRAAHAGGAYDADPEGLGRHLDGLLAGETRTAAGARLAGILAPHIDLHRGGHGYGRTYAALRGHEPPEVVVVLGTAHAPTRGRFVVCDKGFQTPRGDLPLDEDFFARLERRVASRFPDDLLVHETEHSIEFQALMLAHLYAPGPLPSLLPILCGSMEDCLQVSQSPEDVEEIRVFLDALRATYAEEKRRVLVVAGADLSHVGPHFGDRQGLSPGFLEEVRRYDLDAMGKATEGSGAGFLEAVAGHRNSTRICSVAAIFALLSTIQPERGELLIYDQAVDPGNRLAVTFAGAAFYGAGSGLAPLEESRGEGR